MGCFSVTCFSDTLSVEKISDTQIKIVRQVTGVVTVEEMLKYKETLEKQIVSLQQSYEKKSSSLKEQLDEINDNIEKAKQAGVLIP